jgi:hypothetical protein
MVEWMNPGVPQAIVAIPVKDEATRIGDCLAALAGQTDLAGRPIQPGTFGVLLLLNNCRDDTAAVVAGLTPTLPFPLRAIERELPAALRHAGGARRIAMDAAADWLEERGAILSTDADTRVAPDWVARQLAAFAAGADAVAGHVAEDPAEYRRLPQALRRRERRERRYDEMLAELEAHLDPREADPWPRHRMMAGASFGVTLDAYRTVGGLPILPAGEDRALGRLLARHDRTLRHALDVRVTTSCRLVGRAAGGMADTLRHRLDHPESPCDQRLEPALDAVHRAFWHATLRRQHQAGELGDVGFWAPALRLDPDMAAAIVRQPAFGPIWDRVERLSPSLARRRLMPHALPLQMRRAEGILAWLRDQAPGRRAAA